MRIAAIVLLYNPTEKVITNIETYINYVDKLYVIDNSDSRNLQVVESVKKISKVMYISNNGNKGIGFAYNRAAEIAMKERFSWLVTMDQDSRCNNKMLNKIINYISTVDTESIGIASPVHKIYDHQQIRSREVQETMAVMSSGNFLNLSVYKRVGKFNESYFIDQVDYEYCLRINHRGYKVIVLGNAIMEHELGIVKKCNGELYSFHSPIRIYYYIRNMLYLRQKYKNIYPEFIDKRTSQVKNDVIIHLKYAGKRVMYIKFIIHAFLDYGRKRKGKYR